jgi:hypothetical protein
MSNSWVTNAALTKDDAGKPLIELTVQVDDFPDKEIVEISGQATQEGGAFANFYELKTVPAAVNGADGEPHKTVKVTTHPIPPNQFAPEKEVITVLRVSMVWVTVLQTQPVTNTPGSDPAWGPPTAKASLDGNVSSWP